MTGFFPVDRGIFTSSVWLAGTPEEKVLWIWLIGSRDDDGVVRHRELAICYGTGLNRPVVDAALVKFSSPDPDSRTPMNDGRRIDRTADGFIRILNHELYYSRDYSTPRWRRWRERKGVTPKKTVGKRKPTYTPTKDTDTDTDTNGGRKEEPPALPPADRTERAIQATTDGLRTKLYALVDAAVQVDPKKRDPVELMRIFTGYTKADGRAVHGVVNAALLTFERLEKSVADAEATVAEWRHGTA